MGVEWVNQGLKGNYGRSFKGGRSPGLRGSGSPRRHEEKPAGIKPIFKMSCSRGDYNSNAHKAPAPASLVQVLLSDPSSKNPVVYHNLTKDRGPSPLSQIPSLTQDTDLPSSTARQARSFDGSNGKVPAVSKREQAVEGQDTVQFARSGSNSRCSSPEINRNKPLN
ncbi:hypothetical protein G7K_3619-t1 [Saitoella complicata NRRL Y-17804]|uniref:Uncharacterized protein n=1 Tax=Saitoella complicata (strain BCRC 22490 / CBS 7301 / JCM 7358 / NBRC 10748 / NRRL Y-17804) TaxID=698492 RepID=A0A0E9NI02_SAICN|nr:hypothetical protein G7K_3619-t1 [Saitoella complicata NRRL Y-17804]